MRRGTSKQAILRAASAEFARHGYSGARVERIAVQSGLNKQLIYYYFGSKARLYAAAAAEAIQPASGAPSGTPESVRRLVLDVMASLRARPELVALLVDPNPAPEARAQARDWIERAQTAFRHAVSAAQGSGHARDDVDPARAAHQALVLCVGFLALREYLDVDPDAWARDVGDTLVRATAW